MVARNSAPEEFAYIWQRKRVEIITTWSFTLKRHFHGRHRLGILDSLVTFRRLTERSLLGDGVADRRRIALRRNCHVPWLLHIFKVWSFLQLTINISRLRTFTLILQISKRKAIERENCKIFDNTTQFLKILSVIDLKKIENYDDLYFIDNYRLGLASFFNSLLGVCVRCKKAVFKSIILREYWGRLRIRQSPFV